MKRKRKKERKILDEYLEASLGLLNNDNISKDDINNIAQELGFSSSDLTKIEEAVEKLKERGESSLKNGYYDGAIQDLTKAVALSPFDGKLKSTLAECYFRRGKEDHSRSDFSQARGWAEEAIRVDPSSQHAYQILHSIRRYRERQNKRVIQIGVIGGVIILTAVLFLLFLPLRDSQTGPVPLPQGEVIPAANNSEAAEAAAESSPLKQIPVRLAETADSAYSIHSQSSILSSYKNSFAYELTAEIENKESVLTALMVKAAAYDSTGRAVFIVYKNLLAANNPPVYPGDYLPLYILKYDEKKAPDVDTIEISFQLAEGYKYLGPSLVFPEIETNWETAKPPGIDISLTRRESRIAELNPPSHFLVLAVKNTGTRPIDNLRIRIDHHDAKGEILTSALHYLVLSSGPRLRPGKQFPEFFADRLPQGTKSVASVSATVIEAQ